MKWIKANDRTPKKISKVIFRQISTKCILSESMARDWIEDEDLENLEWLDESDLPNEPSIHEDKFVDRLFTNLNKLGYDTSNCDGDTDPAEIIAHWVDCLVKDSQPQPLQEDCACTPDQTTGHTAGKCNVCGKEAEEAAEKEEVPELTEEEIRKLALVYYGDNPHLYGGQRDGFVVGYKAAQYITDNKVEVKWEENMK